MKTEKNIDLSPILLIGMLLAALVMLVGCKDECSPPKLPAIVLGKTNEDEISFGSITLKQSDGRIKTLSTMCNIGHDLANSYSKGDTIK